MPEGDVGSFTVLDVGQSVRVHNKYGTFTMRALSATQREVTVQYDGEESHTTRITLDKRNAAFHGLTGIYVGRVYALDSMPVSIQEGHLYLKSKADADTYLWRAPGFGYVSGKDAVVAGLFNPEHSRRPTLDLFVIHVGDAPFGWTPDRAPRGDVEISK